MESQNLLRRGLLLETLTLLWNVVGVGVVLWAVLRSGSVALAGFGLDSLIEIGASTVVIWELSGTGQKRQKRALRLIGAAFLALALYILAQSLRSLLLHVHSETSLLGVVWLALTFGVMMILAIGKHRTGTRLGNPVLLTEGRVTRVDAYLAASVLVGLVFNAAWGWWWADPLAGLVIVVYGFKEGLHAWKEGA
jgi:divalent metal cation (Fe/Co/Zn/Cd) transporter